MEGKIGFSFQSLLKLLEKKGESFEPYDFVDVKNINIIINCLRNL